MKLKRFLAVFLVAVFAYFGSTAVLNKLEAKEMRAINGDSFDDDSANTNEHEHLILMVGVDENPDGENEDFTRTDTIMLIKANSETGKVDILSIPRDTRVKIRDTFDKVNHAHAFGGIDLTMQTLRNFLGLDIDYYVQVNFKAVENIIDALGGVDFDVPKGFNVKTDDVTIKEGKNHFNGKEALRYVRTRSVYNNGDIGRVEAQQGFMKAMVDEIVKKSENIDLTTFVTNYLKYVKTNVPMGTILDLTNNIKNFSSDKVKTHLVPGHEQTIYGTSYYLPDFDKTLDIVDKNFETFKLKNWTRDKAGFDSEIEEDTNEEDEYYEPVAPQEIEYTEPSYSNNYDYVEEEYVPDTSYTPQRPDASYTPPASEEVEESPEEPSEVEKPSIPEEPNVPEESEEESGSESSSSDIKIISPENND